MADTGRPPVVLTDEQVIQVEALATYLSIERIADYLEISRPTFYEIMERQPEVSLRYKKGKAKTAKKITKSLIQQGLEGNTAALIFYLKTQERWKESSTVEHTGDINITNITRTIIDPAK